MLSTTTLHLAATLPSHLLREVLDVVRGQRRRQENARLEILVGLDVREITMDEWTDTMASWHVTRSD